MNKITVAIIEDELPAVRLLSRMLSELRPEWEIVILPGNIEESVEWFAHNPHPDILFLDIQLTDGNSFLFIEQAKPQSIIVFTTAYDEFAVQAFSVNSIDYLLKPVSRDRLEEAVCKFERLVPQPGGRDVALERIEEAARQFARHDKPYRTRFLIPSGDKFVTLQVDEVAYFYSQNKITFAVTHQNREHTLDMALDTLAEQLDPDRFFRANRQMLLGIDSVQRIEPYFQYKTVVHVNPPFAEQIVVSREKSAAFKQWLDY